MSEAGKLLLFLKLLIRFFGFTVFRLGVMESRLLTVRFAFVGRFFSLLFAVSRFLLRNLRCSAALPPENDDARDRPDEHNQPDAAQNPGQNAAFSLQYSEFALRVGLPSALQLTTVICPFSMRPIWGFLTLSGSRTRTLLMR